MDIRLTEEQREISSGRICPYCHVPTEYKNSIEVYGVDYGMIYYCPQCGAYVGVHKGTGRAKGRLANAELRRCKIEAHRYFDELYKRGLMKRREAYKWLSDQLGLPPEYTHIGMFNPETCAKVVDVSKKHLLTMRFALRRQDKIKAHFEPNGDEMLNRIKESLTRFFAADRSEFPEGYREIELIRRVVRPEVKGCYRNAHLLTLSFPDRVRYVEGKTHTVIPIGHAFNRVGDKYIGITFEFALESDPTQYEYVAFGEYPAGVIEEITNQTGHYGDIYRFCYCAAQMALEKMNPRT